MTTYRIWIIDPVEMTTRMFSKTDLAEDAGYDECTWLFRKEHAERMLSFLETENVKIPANCEIKFHKKCNAQECIKGRTFNVTMEDGKMTFFGEVK